jgi:diguanylate cyclase (GGDEF)-like protein
MKNIRDAVLKCLDEYENEDLLLPALNKIIEEGGQEAYPIILHIFTHVLLEPGEAEESWKEIINLHSSMTQAMGKKISIRTAICEYFCSVHKTIRNPKVVEIHVFEKTLKDSRYDGLTGLMNRQALDETLNNEFNRSRRHKEDLSIVFFDLDNFKKVNDIYGHLAGDEALKHVANILLMEKRLEDIAARYGGEELVLVLPETAKENAYVLAERIRSKVEAMIIPWDGNDIHLTISGGISAYPVDADSVRSLLQKADQAVQQAKESGKNKILL